MFKDRCISIFMQIRYLKKNQNTHQKTKQNKELPPPQKKNPQQQQQQNKNKTNSKKIQNIKTHIHVIDWNAW